MITKVCLKSGIKSLIKSFLNKIKILIQNNNVKSSKNAKKKFNTASHNN